MSTSFDFSKLTPEAMARIIESAEVGVPFSLLHMSAKVAPTTFKLWLKQGEQDSENWTEGQTTTTVQRLYENIMFAYSRFILKRYKKFDSDADLGFLKNATFTLEKLFPHVFGEVKNVSKKDADEEPQSLLDIPEERKSILINQIKRLSDKKDDK